MDFDFLSSSFEVEEDDLCPDVQILFPEGVVVAIAGVEKAREVEVLMLEELEHWAADMDNR